jgi:hypothetical protein
MIGAGILSALAPAAGAAGSGLLLGLALAAAVAYCNATSSARLASRYPQSGGTYVYGRERLGDFWGYLAGWGFKGTFPHVAPIRFETTVDAVDQPRSPLAATWVGPTVARHHCWRERLRHAHRQPPRTVRGTDAPMRSRRNPDEPGTKAQALQLRRRAGRGSRVGVRPAGFEWSE